MDEELNLVEDGIDDEEQPSRFSNTAERALGAVTNAVYPEPQPVTSTTEANGDDLSDLFKTPDENDLDMKTDDLVDLDDEDIFGDGGEDMSDITDVTNADIMGEESPSGAPASYGVNRRYKTTARGRRAIRPAMPPTIYLGRIGQ